MHTFGTLVYGKVSVSVPVLMLSPKASGCSKAWYPIEGYQELRTGGKHQKITRAKIRLTVIVQ